MHVTSIGNSYKNYNKRIAFKAVSIDTDRLYKKPNSVIISEAQEQIDELVKNGTDTDFESIIQEYNRINDDMNSKRNLLEDINKDLVSFIKLININSRELKQKSNKLVELKNSNDNYQNRTQEIIKISDEAEKVVKDNCIERDFARQKTRRNIEDYKGSFTKINGFQKIAGYETEKNVLDKYFISEIKKEQNGEPADVPNAVLFFGPTGNGKTTYAKAFANETGCKLVPVRIETAGLNINECYNLFFKNLIIKAQKAKEQFEKTGKRTIILVDEIDKVSDKDSYILPELTDFLSNCSEKYHCTVFCTSNHPLNITLPMDGKNKIFPYIVSMDPPNIDNKAAVLKFYLNGRVSPDFDYHKLAEYMAENEIQKEKLFNIAQIKEDICLAGENKPITEEEIKENIDKTQPNISNEDIEKYILEMKQLIKNEVVQ